MGLEPGWACQKGGDGGWGGWVPEVRQGGTLPAPPRLKVLNKTLLERAQRFVRRDKCVADVFQARGEGKHTAGCLI